MLETCWLPKSEHFALTLSMTVIGIGLVFNMSPKKLEYVPKRKVRKCPQNKWKSEFVPKINNLNLSPNKFKFVLDLGWPYWPYRVCVVPQRILNMMGVYKMKVTKF